MDTTEEETEKDTPKPKSKENQVRIVAAAVAVAALIFLGIQYINGSHSYGEAREKCQELIQERTPGFKGVSWRVELGGHAESDKSSDGSYGLPIEIWDSWGNEETRVCIASFHRGNWDVYVL